MNFEKLLGQEVLKKPQSQSQVRRSVPLYVFAVLFTPFLPF